MKTNQKIGYVLITPLILFIMFMYVFVAWTSFTEGDYFSGTLLVVFGLATIGMLILIKGIHEE